MTLTFDRVSHHPRQQTLWTLVPICGIRRRHTTMSHNPIVLTMQFRHQSPQFRYISEF